jgi:hypothetical protein
MKNNNFKKYKALLSIVLFAGLVFTSCKNSPTSSVDEPELNAVSGLSGNNVAHTEASNTAATNGVIIIDSFDQGPQSVGSLTGFFASQRTGRDLYEGSGPIGSRRELAGSENSPGTVNLSISGSTPGEMGAAYSGSSTHSSLIDLRYGSCSDPILSGQKRSIIWGEVTCDPSTYQLDLDLSGLTSFEIDFTNMQGGSKWSAGIYLSSGTGNNFIYREVEIPFQATPFTFTISASDFSGITEADLADIDGIIVTMGNNGNVASNGNVTISEVRANVESTEPVSNTFISDGSVRTWDPLFPDENDNRYYNWATNICVENPEFGLNANWINEKNASVISQVATFETYTGYGFDAEWINAWPSISSSGSGGPSFGVWNNVSWTKYTTTVNGDAGDYVVQFLADNCSWIYLDGTQIGFQDANFTNSGNNGKYPVTLNGTDQELSFIIFDGGGQAGGKFRLETLSSFEDNGGSTDDFGDNNTAPVADAGADQTLNATGQTTPITLDGSGSSDADGDALTYSWSDGSSVVSTDASFTTNLADGDYTFTLTVSDGEATDSDEVSITVVNTVPVANAGQDVTKEATGPTTAVTLSGSGTDADGDNLTYSWSNGDSGSSTTVNLGVGVHSFTFTVSDGQSATDTDEVTVTIEDTKAPVISYSQETGSLWPPNHKMVLVATGIIGTDIVDGAVDVMVTVSSNESSNGKGDGNTNTDYEIRSNVDGSYDVYVRAERSGKGGGRTYTIHMATMDAAGNSSSESFDVSVAKSQGRTK